ncbi:MAG: hypothetical protein MUO26_15705 [Methanotrichaceae archaeon]|nr:hypothetical protein [Methanotrichaceae archaeon]
MKITRQMAEETSKAQLQKSQAAARLEVSASKEFKLIDQRVFSARQVMFVSADEKPLYIRIAGAEPLMGKVLTIKNTKNPNSLQVKADECLLQSKVDNNVFFAPKGEIVVTADRSFKPLENLDSTKTETLVRLPSKDPDKVVLDGRVFLQTGTVCVQGQGLFVVLGDVNGAI